MPDPSAIQALCMIAEECGFSVICRGDEAYDWGREISNSRFHFRPLAIVLPKTADHVAHCVKFCTQNGVPFRIRSGGHQHEGMCSLDDGLVIRLSDIHEIEYVGDDKAWIGVGKPLKDVYDELELRGKTIPGGGCWSVNVGGLTLGGGWGTSVRKMGLTCDNFENAELVTAKGEVIHLKPESDEKNGNEDDRRYDDLFWALRGGGGGNFGVVTRFLFRLSDIGPVMSSFAIDWCLRSEDELAGIVEYYLENQTNYPSELTTAMGLRVRHDFMKRYYPVGISGVYYGSEEELRRLMEPFIDKYPPTEQDFSTDYQLLGAPTLDKPAERPRRLSAASATIKPRGTRRLSELINDVVDHLSLGAPAGESLQKARVDRDAQYIQNPPPQTTCLAPWPHKVSSGFLAKGRSARQSFARKAVRNLLRTNRELPNSSARLYMVLHSMPGPSKIKPEQTAFFWRGYEFLVQFQAWWADPSLADSSGRRDQHRREAERYMQWIRASREELAQELEGAFINFVDRDIPIEVYYGGNFGRLQQIKRKYDKDNVFCFPLSIPPAEN